MASNPAANPAAIAPAAPARENLQPPLDTAAGAAARESVAAASSTAGRSPAQNSAPSPATTAGHTVQFANSGRVVPASVAHSRTPSGADGVDGLGGGTSTAPRDGRPPTLLGKLRALASRGDDDSSPTSSDSDDSPGDADAESSGGEGPAARPKRQLRRSRPRRRSDTTPDLAAPAGGSSSTTPRASARGIGRSPFLSRHARVPSAPADSRLRAAMLSGRRRVPPPFASSHGREGVSEDEGKERLNRRRLRDAWANNPKDDRPRNLRRLTALAGPRDNPDSLAAAWRRHRGDRSSLSGQRWKHIKASLRMMGQRRRDTSAVDQAKSAELLAELSSGVPAALLLASMFQRDEHGKRRIPILLEQLKVRITDSYLDSPSAGDRHPVFRIELEYGSGLTRMKWVIHRSIRDFANLHLKYKLRLGTQKYITLRAPDAANSLPRFPKSALPYLRGVRGLEDYIDDDDDDEDEDEQQQEQQQDEGPPAADDHSVANRPRRKRPSSRPPSHRRSSGSRPGSAVGPRRESYPERQRKKLETYLQKMIRFFIFQPDSNRLCRFLELSALGVRLAAEGSYHGKEGFLFIQYSKGLDFRSAFNPSLIKSRHSPKWFLVRHSYVVCVDSPEEMHIYDVFLVDPAFCIQNSSAKVDIKGKEIEGGRAEEAPTGTEAAGTPKPSTPPSGKHHTLKLRNSERKLRLLARNERQLRQFEDSIRFMVANTPWSRPNRFGSFAPVRPNCFAQWLVDARDHMWMVSRAINQAKDVVYIHDWWLSPELYMRRPAAISQKWRLDRLLQRKAVQGVKIFVIMYRNINSAIPIDSEYSKFSLLDLHPNVFVQRSPNQFRQNTFFWAHHEKVCIVDHTLAFVGGIDLCFGRWDTPQHLVTDDKLTGFEQTDLPKDADHCQLWPGKDYSNPRMQDFYDLDKPYEEMYDREAVPRMPWHDISMHVVGQPARDLTRHFVQRWNYILRQRKPTRPTPFLLPPPDFSAADLEALGLDGTCEIQVLRSSSMWSTGTPDTTEHSIMNAYVKLIEQSDHFVYMENQFFISACDVHGKRVENLIADALVERIVRAAEEGTNWRAVILIPLMPGFQNPVDTEGGTSVRLIMMCQYRSICRGEASIFGRLRARGIDPADYIEFYSLRNWGKIGPRRKLVTEQLYIHAKCLIVDDRAALIASANINERSMLGSRDSEAGAVVRDTDLLWSSMDGRPYLVGRFPHTLRMRLMREHLGIDVDELLEKQMDADAAAAAAASDETQPDSPERVDGVDRADQRKLLEHRHQLQDEFIARSEDIYSFNHDVDWEQGRNPNLLRGGPSKKLTSDSRVIGNSVHAADVRGEGIDHMQAALTTATSGGGAPVGKGRDSVVRGRHGEVLVSPEAEAAELGTRPGPDRLAGQPETGTTEQSLSNNGSPGESVEAVDETIKAPNGADDNAVASTAPSDHPLTHTAARKILGTNLPSHRESVGSNNGHGGSGSGNGNGNGNGNGYGAAAAVGGGAAAPAVTQPIVDVDCMCDPVHSSFYCGIWRAVADKNTRLYRTVFRCMPDSEVKSWREYKEYAAYAERFVDAQNSYYYNDRNRSPSAEPATQRGPNAGAGGEGDGGDGGDGAAGAAPPPGPAVATVAPPSGVPTVDEQVVQTDKLPTSQQLMMSSPGEHGETDATAPSTELSRLLSTEQLRNWAAEANRAQMEREKTAVAQGTTTETADAEKQKQGQGGGGETSEGLGRENKKEQVQEPEGEKMPSPAPPPQPSVTVSEPTEPTVAFPDVETEKGQSPANAGAATADSHQQQQQHLQRPQHQPSQRRRRRATTRGSRRSFLASDDILSMGEAEELLQLVQGHLVRWPYDWLEKEEEGGNWLYALDQISPLEIYN